MAGIIKATGRSQRIGVHAGEFNFDDLSSRANAYLDRVRHEAAQVIARAREEAAQIRREAEEQGRQEGMQAAEKLLRDRVQQQLTGFVPALEKAVDAVRLARQEWLNHWEQNVVRLAGGIAARVIRRELMQTPQIQLDWIREALELASGSNRLQLHLNPRDHELLGDQVQQLVTHMNKVAHTEVVADPHIAPGGCKVTTEAGEIDQQIEAQLNRITSELT